ncbi:IclR family transcriptional regulator [Nocardia cyriacigeorgica]|uniref:IclR family transcriptional regulator n=1 Tax=Nocardia cyriacigeorgica TaxID=135487 RepID=UPI001894DBA3|nr:IclR family transcriptional regulator [Nocardia cyriacigeorgica]MBF6289723.1 IclR family transcriptional regulator [Nocardia cyriacigeorgica]
MTVDELVHARSAPLAPASMIERMTLILNAFDGPAPVLTLLDVVDRTGLPRSSVHRIIDQMLRLRWLAHAPGGYRLGTRALELGGLAVEHLEIRQTVSPLLPELCRRTGLVAHLGVLDGPDVLVVDKVADRCGAGIPTRLGGRMPAHCTAIGKALLATLSPRVLELAFRERLPQLTPRTIGHRDDLRRELDRVRDHQGIAVDHGEALSGVACVAVAIRTDAESGGLAAVSLSGRLGDGHAPGAGRVAQVLVEVVDANARRVVYRRRPR